MAYHNDARALLVEFNNGQVYVYENVEPDVAMGVIFDPESQGKSFNKEIKNGGYDYRRLSEEEAATLA